MASIGYRPVRILFAYVVTNLTHPSICTFPSEDTVICRVRRRGHVAVVSTSRRVNGASRNERVTRRIPKRHVLFVVIDGMVGWADPTMGT